MTFAELMKKLEKFYKKDKLTGKVTITSNEGGIRNVKKEEEVK